MKELHNVAEDYLNYCRFEKRLSEGTLQAYSYDMVQFEAFIQENHLMNFQLSGLNRSVLQKYLGEMNNKFKAKTVKRKMACLKGFFSYLEEETLLENNPFDKLKIKIKEPFTLPEVMTLKEVKKMLTAAYKHSGSAFDHEKATITEFIHLRDIAVLEFLFATGMRVHELCNLTFETYNLKTHSLKIIGKGQKQRHIYVSNQEVVSSLSAYLKCAKKIGYKSEHIFLNKWGDKLSCQAVRNIVSKYAGIAGIKKNITPHAFRHTFATLLLEEGVDIKYIQEFLGHSSISTTQIYLHISERKARNILSNKHPRKKLFLAEYALEFPVEEDNAPNFEIISRS